MGCVSVCSDVGILWLNAQMDRVGIYRGNGAVREKQTREGGDRLFRKFSALAMPRSAILAAAVLLLKKSQSTFILLII